MGCQVHFAPYSFCSLYCITSNCSCPTVPIIFLPLNWLMKSWATPSSISCSMPLFSCFAFMGSAFSMYLNISGEKLGRPLKCICCPSVSVSPILNVPLSGSPTISPGYACSMVLFRCAMNCAGEENRSVLLSLTWWYGVFRWNIPEHTLQNAMHDRWFGSMFAVILNMNPLNVGSSGCMVFSSAVVGPGGGAICTKQSSSSFTPKLLSADPKKTGAICASLYVCSWNCG